MTAHGLVARDVLDLFAAPNGVVFNRRLRVISSAIWTAPSRFTTTQISMVASYAKSVGPLGVAPLPGGDVVAVLTDLLRAEHPDTSAAQRRRRAEALLAQAVASREAAS